MIEKAQRSNEVEARLLAQFERIHPDMHATFIAMAADWAKRFPVAVEQRRAPLRLVHYR